MPTTVHGAEPPAFAPWDRVQFLKRLESFRHVDKWMSKPEKDQRSPMGKAGLVLRGERYGQMRWWMFA